MPRVRPALAAGLFVLALAPATRAQTVRQLFVTVEDSSGQPVLDVRPEEFSLEEDGAPRTITRASLAADPMRVVLLVDNGDSTQQLITPLRQGLHTFLDNLQPEHEVALVTIGRQLRVREQPTTDREKLGTAVDNIFSDKGAATVLLDSLRESWNRFLRQEDGYWPVFVIVTTDGAEGSSATRQPQYDGFVGELLAAGASVHAAALQERGGGLTTQVALNLTQNTGGEFKTLAASTGLAAEMSTIAARLGADYDFIKTRYLVRYESRSKDGDARLGLTVARDDVRLQMFPDRRSR